MAILIQKISLSDTICFLQENSLSAGDTIVY